jgi:thymidylate synthase
MDRSLRKDVVKAFDLQDAWRRCLDLVLDHGYEYTIQRGSFADKKRKELDFVDIQIERPYIEPIIPEIPSYLDGIVPPPTSMEYVNNYLAYIITPHKQDEDYTYGERLTGQKYRDKEINQINEVIEIYKASTETNQATMEIGMPTDIMLKDPPCMRIIDTRVRYGKLHFITYFRSWDLWGGFPSNLAVLQMLKEYMSRQIGVEDGEIIALSKGLHLYDYSWEWAEYMTGRKKLEDQTMSKMGRLQHNQKSES